VISLKNVSTKLASSVAILLCASTLAVTTTGCTQSSIKQAVANIGADIPKVQPYITVAAGVAEGLDPAASVIIVAANTAVQAGLTQLAQLCTAYAAAPSTSTWQSIVAAVTSVVGANETALLNALKVVDPDSRAKATTVIGSIQTALLLIQTAVQAVQGASQNAAMAAAEPMTVAQMSPYLNRPLVEQATGHSFEVAIRYETAQGF
jgi:hypothetical protein